MRALTPWRASSQLSGLHDEIDEILDRFFGSEAGWRGKGTNGGMFAPALESFVRDDKLVFRADLPGIDPKAVDIHVEGDRLTVRGERKSVEEDKNRLHREVSYGRFERTVQLPAGIDPDTVKAAYRDGVLEIAMDVPKSLVAKKVNVAIQ